MKNQSLFKQNTQTENYKINELRALARDLRDRNNKLVNQIWEIDLKLVENDSDELRAKRTELTEQLRKEGFEQKFKDTIEEIKALETALYGHSNVGGPSPYVL